MRRGALLLFMAIALVSTSCKKARKPIPESTPDPSSEPPPVFAPPVAAPPPVSTVGLTQGGSGSTSPAPAGSKPRHSTPAPHTTRLTCELAESPLKVETLTMTGKAFAMHQKSGAFTVYAFASDSTPAPTCDIRNSVFVMKHGGYVAFHVNDFPGRPGFYSTESVGVTTGDQKKGDVRITGEDVKSDVEVHSIDAKTFAVTVTQRGLRDKASLKGTVVGTVCPPQQ